MTRTEFAPRLPFLQAWMDGKVVEIAYLVQTKSAPPWRSVTTVDEFTYTGVQFRLKPHLREWWVCTACRYFYNRDALNARYLCPNGHQLIHLREVLPDAAGGAA